MKLIFNPELVDPEEFKKPAKHIRLRKNMLHLVEDLKKAEYAVFEYKGPSFRQKVEKLYGPQRCEYCGRKIDHTRDGCKSCGAPY